MPGVLSSIPISQELMQFRGNLSIEIDALRTERDRESRQKSGLIVFGNDPMGYKLPNADSRQARGRTEDDTQGYEMSTFGEDLIQSLEEALAHAKGEGPANVHAVVSPLEVRKQIKLTQAQMAPLMGMSVSGYRKWEQGRRQVSGPAATLLRVIATEPEAVKRALQVSRHT